MAEAAREDRRGAWAAGLLGFAFGGFLDGILLHQVLQWHHLLSGWEGRATIEQLRFHILWDGVFHAAHYAILAAGLAVLWTTRPGAGRPPLRLGWFAVGFGAWHVLDAVVNHWALGLHRIRQDSPQPLLWDLAFFGLGAAALALGWVRRRGPSLRAGAVATLVLLAGAGAALPARGPVLAALSLPEGAGPEAALRLAAAADADLAGADAAGRVWLFRAAEPGRLRRAALAAGALPVPLPAALAGRCLTAL